MSDRVLVNEAWYRCAIHGWQYHATGPNLDHPCLKCALEAPNWEPLGDWESTLPNSKAQEP